MAHTKWSDCIPLLVNYLWCIPITHWLTLPYTVRKYSKPAISHNYNFYMIIYIWPCSWVRPSKLIWKRSTPYWLFLPPEMRLFNQIWWFKPNKKMVSFDSCPCVIILKESGCSVLTLTKTNRYFKTHSA